MARRYPLAALWLVVACTGREVPGEVALTVGARAGSGIDLAKATWEPAAAVRRVERADGALTLVLDPGAIPAAMAIRAPGACPASVKLEGAAPGERRKAELAPWIDVGEDRAQVGFDTAFEVEVKPGCREAVAGRIKWRVVEGKALPEMREEKNGFRLRGRTAKLAEARPDSHPLPWGIVPLSPATRGAVTLEATWEGVGPTVTRTLHIAAAARAGGIPSIAVGQRVLLGGAGWSVAEHPPAGRAQVAPGEVSSFMPDAGGRWVLSDGAGNQLALRAGRHAETPLDCGRSECHAAAAAGAANTRMTTVLADGLRGTKGEHHDAGCAIPCHAVGEPGLHDGGFADIARELGAVLPTPGPEAWDALPRPLRRLGGVGCTACHGPGAIPERAARWTILRSDVCATCHDAPPRYGHVAAWRASRMARSDADPATRRTAKCASCHTTAGFLDAIGVRPTSMSDGGPDEPRGIGCAACHAPHSPDPLPTLVRRVPPPASLGRMEREAPGTSSVCLRCHAPLADDSAPSASAASLLLGRVAKEDPEGPSPHAKVRNACLGCHAAGAPEAQVERGAGHAFRADKGKCQSCHDCPQEERLGKGGKRVAERASELWALLRKKKVVESDREKTPHAATRILAAAGSKEARAAWKVLVVLEDPAAGAHNAALARTLLDEAESLLNGR